MAIEGLVERMFCLSCFRCPFAVASYLGRCLRTRLDFRPGQVAKYPALMALVQVCTTGLNAHRCRYWTRSTLVFYFVCATGKGVKYLGDDRRGIREIYVIEANSGVSLTIDGGVFIAQFDLAFAENSREVAVTELAN